MGSAPPSSAPSGSGTVTAKEVAGAGDGNGAPSVSGTASGMAISGPTGNSGPAANRGAEGCGSAAAATASAPPPTPARRSSPACPGQPPGLACCGFTAAGRGTPAAPGAGRCRSLSGRAAGLGVLRDQRARKVHVGGGPAARGQPQRHLDAV